MSPVLHSATLDTPAHPLSEGSGYQILAVEVRDESVKTHLWNLGLLILMFAVRHSDFRPAS